MAAAAWRAPVVLLAPVSTDAVPTGLAVSPSGLLTIGYGLGDPTARASSSAGVVALGPGGASPPEALPEARQILGLAYLGQRLEVLAGTTPGASGLSCCGAVETVSLAPGSGLPAAAHVLLRGLSGVTAGELLRAGPGLLALVANASGVWVAQADSSGRFGPARRLSPTGEAPRTAAATALGRRRWLAAWSSGTSTIEEAPGGPGGPARSEPAVTLPAGRTVEQLALAPGRPHATLAFTESWYDGGGAFHTRVEAADFGANTGPNAVSPWNELATGLSLAGAPHRGQVLAWQACDLAAATCAVEASVRRPDGSWSAPADLGPVDPASTPVGTETSAGTALVGWIDAGDVWVGSATPSPNGSSSWTAQRLSRAGNDSSLMLAPGPASSAVAAWTAGIAQQSVLVARYQP